MKRSVVVVLVLSLHATNADARQAGTVGRWHTLTAMNSVRSVAMSGDSSWAGTAGGVFLYSSTSNRFSKFTNSEGLNSNDVTATVVDQRGRVWLGSSEGFVNMLDPSTNQWIQVRGIEESNRVQKSVRSLYAQNDSLFIGTDFGVVVYLVKRGEFGDTYSNFGFQLQPRVNDILIQKNTIWVATDSGAASASLSSANLSSPIVWTRYPVGNSSFPAVTSLALLRDTVVAATLGGVSYFRNGAFVQLQQFSGKPVVSMKSSGQTASDRLFVLWNGSGNFTIEAINFVGASAQVVAVNSQSAAVMLGAQPKSSSLWVATSDQGLEHWDGVQWKSFMPNSPRSNLFTSLAVDPSGVLWAGSGISGRGQGFYRFNPSLPGDIQWKNFGVKDYPAMAFDDYFKVSIGLGNSVWVSSWGRGVVEVANDSIKRRISVPTLKGAVLTDTNFVVVGGIVPDADGRTWFVNYLAISKFFLVRLAGESTFDYYAKTVDPNEGRLTSMVIDRNGTKWMANSEPQDKPATGLTFFNENPSAVAGTQATSGWGVIRSPQLPSDVVLSLAVDLDGDVCVGTETGMMIITNPRNPTQNYTTAFPVAGQVVQAIAVDAVNNKWVGTRTGVTVLSPDGIRVLENYTVASTNGQLLSDDIRALVIDQKRGIVYVGTEKGLSSLEIAPVQTMRSYSTLEFGPNPFVIPSSDPLSIRNLMANSSIRILSVDGNVVSEFAAQGGGRAFWDGRNSRGEFVTSGIYFIVAYSENGNQLTTGKIAVVRK
jgi:ligand-binding sensor domain-containing protein